MPFQRKKPAQPPTVDEAILKLENFCAYRERCPKEVRTRLTELGLRGPEAEQVLEVLREDGFYDEERFALAYAGGKFRINHWGRVRIRMELRMRDVSPELVQQALDSLEEEQYLEVLQQLLAKKRQHYAGDPQAREKTAAAMIRTGFEPELVFRYL
ncbi:MAG: regulatory protein RecX [Saprospiraceae bacterium]